MGGRSGQSLSVQYSDAQISDAVSIYQSSSFQAINNELRYDKPDRYKDVIRKIDKASVDKTNDVLYRGFDADFTKFIRNKFNITDTTDIDELRDKLLGKVITDKGFSSSSRKLSAAAQFAEDRGRGQTVVMQIEGSKTGIEVSKHVNNFRARQEREFIIKRNSKFKIERVSISSSGKLILYTKVIN